MKRLIVYFLILLGAVWLGLLIYKNPGYILIYYRQWSIETTTWFAILLLLLAFFLLHLLFSLIRGILHLPKRIKSWWQIHREHQAIKLLNRGYADLLKGNYKLAEKHLLKSTKSKSLYFLNYILAAEAADLQQSIKRRDYYLLQAKKNNKENNYLVDIAYIQFLLKNQQAEAALKEIVRLREQRAKDTQLLRLLALSYLQIRDYFHLQMILNELKKNKVFNKEQLLIMEKDTYLNLFKDYSFTDFSDMQKLWNKVPSHLKHDPSILMAYVSHLSRWNREHEGEELIRKELQKNYDPKLMECYVTTPSNEPAKQIALGEKYLKDNAQDAASLRAMGILCLRNHLWGQARDYLERSLKKEATPQAYSSLGYVYEKLGENEKALSYYRKGMHVNNKL
jgi:HemY protein